MSPRGAVHLNGSRTQRSRGKDTTDVHAGTRGPNLRRKSRVIAYFLFPAFQRLCLEAALIPQVFFFFLGGGIEA